MLHVAHVLFNMATGEGSQSDIVRALATIAGALSTPSSSGPAVLPPANSGGRGGQTDTTQAMQNLDTTGHSSRSDSRYARTYKIRNLEWSRLYICMEVLIRQNLIKSLHLNTPLAGPGAAI